MFYACLLLIGNWKGGKIFKVGIFFEKKFVGVGLQEKTTTLLVVLVFWCPEPFSEDI